MLSEKLKVVQTCLSGLEAAGFDVTETTDYDSSVAALLAIGKEYLTPNMSPKQNDFTGDNCYWILLKRGGLVVGGIAARRDRLGDETLGSFWRRTMKRQYGGGETDLVLSVADMIDKEVRGDITYFGDLIISKDYRNYGDHLRLFTMYCQMHAAILWDSDWQYSFIAEKRAIDGGAFTYGFTAVIPGAQEWASPPPANRKSSECCVISSRTNLNDIARYFARSPEKLGIVKDAV